MHQNEPIKNKKPVILIVGASGMLGNAMFRCLSAYPEFRVFGTIRSTTNKFFFADALWPSLISGIEAENLDTMAGLLAEMRPTVVVNCVGVVKQLASSNDPLVAIPINSLLPHRLARLSQLCGSRFVHFSTDCVFDGIKGGYHETDIPNATDLYGRSKLLGEVLSPGAVTLRTSIIGKELNSCHGLIGWFLSQSGPIRGYSRAIFSGLPTIELARVVGEYVIKRPELSGIFNVASRPISKFDLLKLVGEIYGKSIEIVSDDSLVIDRSLDASRFNSMTGYEPPAWERLVRDMLDDFRRSEG